MPASRRATAPTLPTPTLTDTMPRRSRTLVIVLLVAGVTAFVAAGVIGRDDPGDVSVRSDPAVEALVPLRGARVLQQSPVGIDLAPGWELVSLQIFPDDRFVAGTGVDVIGEVSVTEGLLLYTFQPGEGKALTALSAETNCVVATYRRLARPDDIGSIDWCFEVT